MALDPYGSCPCGSGKKFKWCCQPIHVEIGRAFEQHADGQHEAALRIMDKLVAEHPANPEVWGRKAQLLYDSGRMDEAETTLQKALDINPNYPFGYLLRGVFRKNEGEIAGALLLFRKAAELYDPEAKDALANAYGLIGECEFQLHRPVAAHAAFQTAHRLEPTEELSKALRIFDDEEGIPPSARRPYTLMPLSAAAKPERRARWQQALSTTTTSKLADAATAFRQLAEEMPEEAAAWYNLALVRAWLGQNAAALEALDRYVSLEPDELKAASAWTLAEVLRFGQGMEEQADYVEHSLLFQVREPDRFLDFLNVWQKDRFLYGVQVDKERGLVTGVVLDWGGLIAAGGTSLQFPKLGAYFVILAGFFRLWSPNAEALERIRQEVEERAGPSIMQAERKRGPANFADVLAEALVFPVGPATEAAVNEKRREHLRAYFEDKWIHRPLHALNGVPPLDAPGHPILRKKLRGVIQFLEECATKATPYDFEQLRRKLGIATDTAAPSNGQKKAAIDRMGAAELAELKPDMLSDEEADEAYRTAQKLDAHELAARFAKALVTRPGRPDRFPLYQYLVQRALQAGDTDAALQYVDEGEKADCEHNEGRRRNDYELRRGQVYAKRGDAEGARDVFDRLIQRAPAEIRYQGSAAESMLSLKQGDLALRFAEEGLKKAREKNDGDSEQYFLELAAAARKQVDSSTSRA